MGQKTGMSKKGNAVAIVEKTIACVAEYLHVKNKVRLAVPQAEHRTVYTHQNLNSGSLLMNGLNSPSCISP